MSCLRDRFSREGPGTPAPGSGLPRMALMAVTHFWRLVAANMLFLLFSLPVFTIPASLCALDRVCVLIYRDGNLFLWHDFLQEFCRSFLRSLLPGLLLVLLLFGSYFFLSLASGNAAATSLFIIFWAIGGLMLLAAICFGSYFFVLISSLDLNNRSAMKDSILLVLARPGRAILVFFWILGLCTALTALLPVGILLMLFCWFVLIQYPVCFLVYDLAESMILIPYKEKMKHPASREKCD